MKNFIEVSEKDGTPILINVAAIESVTSDKDGKAVIDTLAPGWGLVPGRAGSPYVRFIVSESYEEVKAMIDQALE